MNLKNVPVRILGEKYFINLLKEKIANGITVDCIEGHWLNINKNWVIKLLYNGSTYYVEFGSPSRQIEGILNLDFSAGIHGLINSGSFSYTHDRIGAIEEYVQYFSDQEIKDLILAAVWNNQIYSIAHDSDVRKILFINF